VVLTFGTCGQLAYASNRPARPELAGSWLLAAAIVMPGGSRSYPPGGQCQWPVLAWTARRRKAGWAAGLVRLAGLRVGGVDVVELAARADGPDRWRPRACGIGPCAL